MKKIFKTPFFPVHKSVVNNSGLSIAELLVAMSLTLIVGLSAFQLISNSDRITKTFNKKLDDQIDTKLGDKIILKDLRLSAPSMNVLTEPDDNNLNFFDYDGDRASAYYTGQVKKTRTFTLSKTGKKTFYFLAADEDRGNAIFTDPLTFYEVGTSSSNITIATPITYKGLNYKNFFSTKGPLLVNDQKLVLVDSSSFMMAPNTSIPNKPATFIGRIAPNGGLLDVVKVTLPASLYSHYITLVNKTNVTPTSFDDFMKQLPPVGANGASVRFKGVNLVKYELNCTLPASAPVCELFRSIWDPINNKELRKVSVVKGFDKVIFSRDDLSTSIFQVAMEKAK